ncbi:MAG: hypothetical protein A4E19_07265 [Nitrospira sp. SG-bin1]|nr:MAG: hypothetical protein A4E19_07265 [Nitrospira sp. SG-bin1]
MSIKVGEQLGIAERELAVLKPLVFLYLLNNKHTGLLIQVTMMHISYCVSKTISEIVNYPIAVIILVGSSTVAHKPD